MDRERISELMSAYLDGEVTAAERAETERMLEASPEWRAQLDDFARLSDLIRAVPRESAPDGLAAAIRQQAQAQALLQPEPAPPKRSLRREFVAALAGVAVTAAAWMITVQSLDNLGTPAPEPASAVAVSNRWDLPAAPQTAPLAARDAAARPEKWHEGQPAGELAFDGNSAVMISADHPAERRAGASAAPPFPSAAAAAADDHDDHESFGMGRSLGGGLGGVGAVSAAGDSLRDLVHIGDSLPYLEQSNEGVAAVVELYVVDIVEAEGQLEVVLARNGLQVAPAAAEREADKEPNEPEADKERSGSKRDASEAKDAGGKSPDGLRVVYVDASRETITQVLDDMARENLVARAKLQPPVETYSLAVQGDAQTERVREPQSLAAQSGEKAELGDLALGEQALVDEAVVSTQNYITRRQVLANAAPTEAASTPEQLNAQLGKKLQAGDQRHNFRYQTPRGSKLNRGRTLNSAVDRKAGEEAPADALSVWPDADTPLNLTRSQNAVVLQLDEATGQVANSSLRKNTLNLPQAAALKQAAPPQEKAKLAEPLHETENLAENLPNAAERTIRVLFVLQRAAADEAP